MYPPLLLDWKNGQVINLRACDDTPIRLQMTGEYSLSRGKSLEGVRRVLKAMKSAHPLLRCNFYLMANVGINCVSVITFVYTTVINFTRVR